MKAHSKEIYSNQLEVHDGIQDLLKRYSHSNFKKPYAEHSVQVFQEIQAWLEERGNLPVVLDLCCGVGESTYHLAQFYTNALVIGIDKSLDRITRKNQFKDEMSENALLVRGDLIDLWRLFYENKNDFNFLKQYILYPNPYPKKKHLKLRWYGHPVFKYIVGLNCPIEVRSNWDIYLKDFKFAAQLLDGQRTGEVESFVPERIITPFERKYLNSNHQLFKLFLSAS